MAKLKERFTSREEQKRFKIQKSTQRNSFKVNQNERQELCDSRNVVAHPMKDVLSTKYPLHKNAASSKCHLRLFNTEKLMNCRRATHNSLHTLHGLSFPSPEENLLQS